MENIEFELAAKYVTNTQSNVYITGKAGTGKTTFLRHIKDTTFKKTAVTAPTGVAAMNAGGVTLHSLLQIPFQQFLPAVHLSPASGILDKNTLISNLKIYRDKQEIIRSLDLLIIDEVSMIRADVLDAADTILRHIRKQPSLPFGGLQMLFIGDLYQLPPVVNDHERELMSEYYASPYFFEAHVMKDLDIVGLELQKVYRQKDLKLVNLLNRIRTNECTEDDLELLNDKYNPDFIPNSNDSYIYLSSHNARADEINRTRLAALKGAEYQFEAIIDGEFYESATPAEKILTLKIGAQIMFIKNDKGEDRKYYNGKIGVIEKIADGNIIVGFTNGDETITLSRETWENIRYKYNPGNDGIEQEVLGKFSQYPIRLAWAITIHKSQGLTFDKAIIDAGQSFASGQVYVALSRLTNFDGLVLKSKITSRAIVSDPSIQKSDYLLGKVAQLQKELPNKEKIYACSVILKAFDWENQMLKLKELFPYYETAGIPDLTKAINWAKKLVSGVEEQFRICKKFKFQLEGMFNVEAEIDFVGVNERVSKASSYFETFFKNVFLEFDIHIKEYRPKPKTKKYIGVIINHKKMIQVLEKNIKSSAILAESLSKGGADFDAIKMTNVPEETILKDETKKPEKGETKKISLELFKEGKSISEIASIRSMVSGTIEGHLASFIPTGEIKITELMTETTLSQIVKVIQELGPVPSGEYKAKLGDSVSYAQIKAVQEYLKLNNGNGV
ncbi:MAG: helix-turn-helix domain-containing protein [Bacteroidota bacterium]|nr:helix-turn-helix domain-containing protein [Bacteroidota bacterium]